MVQRKGKELDSVRRQNCKEAPQEDMVKESQLQPVLAGGIDASASVEHTATTSPDGE
jgi:hypothetical protein